MANKTKATKPVTLAQQEQRELSWALYVTEGYVANLAHLRAVNAYTLSRRALAALDRAQKAAEHTAADLRREIAGERGKS